ncbi:putative transmembrane protein [Gregarina niphandrodes]|uniref:Transmembrane protein n=1 Tax=Gregarina niphandrodes TaxID=110365 RepID=A0A023B819_GRENI|nr:putative transmembrane protein [Gregarina niphandrodes]EZG68072.1 putative transmembrane protein [Gregarina niphandrodes]|eukprot:XP_011130113.1 putative transmembrane protein [Gregarina niphandrodes]
MLGLGYLVLVLCTVWIAVEGEYVDRSLSWEVDENICMSMEDCYAPLQQLMSETCGKVPGPMLAPKKDGWASGWQKMATGLSMMGRNAGREMYRIYHEKLYKEHWSVMASYCIVEYPFIVLAVALLLVWIIMPFVFCSKCFKCCKLSSCCCSNKKRKNINNSNSLLSLALLVLGGMFCLWVMILGWVYIPKMSKDYDKSTCGYYNAYDKLLYSGSEQPDGSRWPAGANLVARLEATSQYMSEQAGEMDMSPPNAATMTQSRFNRLFPDMLFTQGILSSSLFTGWGEKTGEFTLDLGLAILDEKSALLKNFQSAYGVVTEAMNAAISAENLDQLELVDFAENMKELRSPIDSSVDEIKGELDVAASNLVDITGTKDWFHVNFQGAAGLWGVFTLLLLLTTPFMIGRAKKTWRMKIHDFRVAKVSAGILSWIWALFALVFCVAGLVFVSGGAATSGVCDALQQIRDGDLRVMEDVQLWNIAVESCLVKNADGSLVVPTLTYYGADLGLIDNVELPAQISKVFEQLPERQLTPMFNDDDPASGWGEWKTGAERTMVLPNAGTQLEQLKAVIGPELAVASYNSFDCDGEPVCDIASTRAGVKLNRIAGLIDIEVALQGLLAADAPSVCFAGSPRCSPATKVVLSMINTEGVLPSTNTLEDCRTETTMMLESSLQTSDDADQRLKLYSLIWQGVRLAALELPLQRAPKFVPETLTTAADAAYVQSYSDFCSPTYPCNLFVGKKTGDDLALISYSAWAKSFPASLETAARRYITTKSVKEGIMDTMTSYTTLKGYSEYVKRIDNEYNCLPLADFVQGTKDLICGGLVTDAASIGFQFWGATVIGVVAMIGLLKFCCDKFDEDCNEDCDEERGGERVEGPEDLEA